MNLATQVTKDPTNYVNYSLEDPVEFVINQHYLLKLNQHFLLKLNELEEFPKAYFSKCNQTDSFIRVAITKINSSDRQESLVEKMHLADLYQNHVISNPNDELLNEPAKVITQSAYANKLWFDL